jgi:hypothetical protein
MSQAQAPRSTFDPIALAASVAAIAAGGTASNAAPAKDRATVYLGIGTLRDGVDPHSDTFNPATDLINLPQMTGLDNMRPDDRKAGTQEFANQQAERNEFLEDLKAQALASMEPGETKIVPLYVTVYRKKDDVVAEVAPTSRAKTSFFGG